MRSVKLEGYTSLVVRAATFAVPGKIKELNQKERRLLNCAIEALKNKNSRELDGKKIQLRELFKKLTEQTVRKKNNCCSNLLFDIVKNFFKNVANAFHLRIGIKRLEKNLDKVFEKSTPRNELFNVYWEMFTTLALNHKQFQLQPKTYRYALKTIHAFYLLSLNRRQIINQNHKHVGETEYLCGRASNELLVPSGIQFMKEKTTLKADRINEQVVQQISNAPEILRDAFIRARDTGKLKDFYEKAFNVDSFDFSASYARISNYENQNRASLDQSTKTEVPPSNTINPLEKTEKAEEVIQNFEISFLDMDATMFGAGQTFFEDQIESYARAKGYDLNPDSRIAIRERIQNKEDFYQNYLTIKNFKKFLLEKENILDRRCTDGVITRTNLDNLIENVAILLNLGRSANDDPSVDGLEQDGTQASNGADVPLAFIVDDKKSKRDNINYLLEVFWDRQARRYANTKNIPIDENWYQTKKKICQEDMTFKRDYSTRFQFNDFLGSNNIYLKHTSEGIFNHAEINRCLQDLLLAGHLRY